MGFGLRRTEPKLQPQTCSAILRGSLQLLQPVPFHPLPLRAVSHIKDKECHLSSGDMHLFHYVCTQQGTVTGYTSSACKAHCNCSFSCMADTHRETFGTLVGYWSWHQILFCHKYTYVFCQWLPQLPQLGSYLQDCQIIEAMLLWEFSSALKY